MWHIESVHEDIKPFKCNICEYITAHKADLKKHVDYVNEGITPFENAKIFLNSQTFKRHIESVHKEIKQFKGDFFWLWFQLWIIWDDTF